MWLEREKPPALPVGACGIIAGNSKWMMNNDIEENSENHKTNWEESLDIKDLDIYDAIKNTGKNFTNMSIIFLNKYAICRGGILHDSEWQL